MVKIFFDARRPELVFALAAILKKIGNEINVIIPATPRTLLEEEKINKIASTLPVSVWDTDNNISVADGEPEYFYLLGLGPDNDTEAGYIHSFLELHGPETEMWVDDHHNWPPELLLCAGANSVAVKIHPVSCLDQLKKMGYEIPLGWQTATWDFRLASRNQQAEFSFGRRYYLALVAGTIISSNIDYEQYYYGGDYLGVFWAILKELQTGTADPQLDAWRDLAVLMAEETEKAKQLVSPDLEFFQEAKAAGRPIGFLKIPDSTVVDVQAILDYGVKKYPWLCVIIHTMGGHDYLEIASSYLDIRQFLEYYDHTDITQEDLFRLMNAEVLRKKVN
ncbi:MAG: hypothetical protein WC453_03185 [Patescibacteria group bacterium]